MNERLDIYGFGSFFNGHVNYADIDVLIIHRTTEYASCQFAIRFKRLLMSKVEKVDITILSTTEEQEFSFIQKSKAWRIGQVAKDTITRDFNQIINKINSHITSR